MCTFHIENDFIINPCAALARQYQPHQIMRGIFPPSFYVENTKISVYVESPRKGNIFFESVPVT